MCTLSKLTLYCTGLNTKKLNGSENVNINFLITYTVIWLLELCVYTKNPLFVNIFIS